MALSTRDASAATAVADTLRLSAARLEHGGQVLMEITGEPGAGKTRLLRNVLRQVAGTDAEVVTAAGSRPFGERPYAALTALMRAFAVAADAGAETADLHRTVRAAWSGRRAGTPLVFGLDDAHLADHASLALLTLLLHDPPPAPFMIVLAHRRRQEPPALAALPPLLAPTVEHLRVTVPPMTVAEFGRMFALEPGPRLASLHAHAGGNPAYGLAVAAAEGGDVPAEADRAVRTLRAEFIGLDPVVRSVLDAGAAAGGPFGTALVAAAGAVTADEAADALEALAARDLIREDGRHGAGWRIRHPVLRDLVYREIPPARRRLLHGRLAEVLRDHGAGRAELAGHIARSAAPGDLAAVASLVAAAEETGPHDPASVVEWLLSARSLVGADVDAGLRVRLDLALAHAYLWSGEPASAEEVLSAGPPATAGARDRIRFTLARARAERILGRHPEAQAIIRAELDAVEGDPTAEVMLAVEAAASAAMCGSPGADAYVERARRAVDAVGDPTFHIAVSIAGGYIAALWGGDDAAIAELSTAALAVDALPDGHLVHRMDPVGVLAWAEVHLERDADALRHFDRALAIADRSGHFDLRPHLLIGRSYINSRLGRLAEGESDAKKAVAAARKLGTPAVLGLALNFLAAVSGYLHGPHVAREIADEAVATMPPGPREWLGDVARRTAVKLRHAAGDSFDAVTAMTRACGEDMTTVESSTRPYWCGVLAEMSLDAGDAEAAAAWIEKGFGFVRPHLPGAAAFLRLAHAKLKAHHGDVAAARAAAEEAVEALGKLGWATNELSARLVLASLHQRLGEVEAMFAELTEARRLAEAVGSPWLRREVIAEQRRLASAAGGSPAHRDATAELSRREAEIARRAVGGATNNEIAADLHVTVKTVEAHLSRVYRKLGVRSRTMLAGALLGMERGAGA